MPMSDDAGGFYAVPPPPKIYTAIVDQILNAIQAGTFPPGSALPSERIMAERLGISRASLREAVRVLEHAGVVDVRTGRGTYVADGGIDKAASLRARTAVAGEHSPLDLMLVRLHLEPLAAELAAAHRNARDLKALEVNLAQHASMLEGADQAEADKALRMIGRKFHLAVASAAHNGVLHDIQERFSELMEEDTWGRMKRLSRARDNKARQHFDDHSRILEEIRNGNPDGARKEMVDHLHRLRESLQGVAD
jgi:GntR family transcriptional regulator, transcriptional repressor for pyruvate dehydrogenase complex